MLPFLFVMPLLFVAGAALVYYLCCRPSWTCPSARNSSATNVKVVYVPKVKEYYELTISLLMCFGFAFQLPIVMALLAMAGVVQCVRPAQGPQVCAADHLRRRRRA